MRKFIVVLMMLLVSASVVFAKINATEHEVITKYNSEVWIFHEKDCDLFRYYTDNDVLNYVNTANANNKYNVCMCSLNELPQEPWINEKTFVTLFGFCKSIYREDLSEPNPTFWVFFKTMHGIVVCTFLPKDL